MSCVLSPSIPFAGEWRVVRTRSGVLRVALVLSRRRVRRGRGRG
ncbi:hypothetical protein SAMN04487818_104147 [Actinokineospora terrae]|uniref:Uncharacterized protein n=1 Tax=Actinokineospora terrae TaxID=155974 RepID=A0A1H9Q9W9_9PSEU|nr:hypothetical protein SAMN04487818_104147 [Actinokineospora terrae]